nr:hypothetical protein [Tanacetum cinerariifolium]
NSAAYKEYYVVASGAIPPKTKASIRKTQSSSDTTITPRTVAGTRLSTSAKVKQPAKSSKEKDLSVLFEVAMTKAEQIKLATKRRLQQTHMSQASGSGADDGTDTETKTEEEEDEISRKRKLERETREKNIRNSAAYKEYYVVASGAIPPKTKASIRKTQSSSDTTITPRTVAGTRLSTSAKVKQPAKSSKEKDLSVLFEVAMTKAEQIKLATKRRLQQTHMSQASGSGADDGTGILPGVPDVPTNESDEEIV